jgi:hypothetical protein
LDINVCSRLLLLKIQAIEALHPPFQIGSGGKNEVKIRENTVSRSEIRRKGRRAKNNRNDIPDEEDSKLNDWSQSHFGIVSPWSSQLRWHARSGVNRIAEGPFVEQIVKNIRTDGM